MKWDTSVQPQGSRSQTHPTGSVSPYANPWITTTTLRVLGSSYEQIVIIKYLSATLYYQQTSLRNYWRMWLYIKYNCSAFFMFKNHYTIWSSIFNYLRNLHTVFSHVRTILYYHQQCINVPISPYPSQSTV